MAGEGALTFLVASGDNSWELFFWYELLTVQSHVLESTSQPLIFFSCVPISTRLCCNKKKVFPTRSREWEEKIVGQNSKLDFFFFSLLCRSECYEDLTSSHCARHSEGSTLVWNSNSSLLLFFRFSLLLLTITKLLWKSNVVSIFTSENVCVLRAAAAREPIMSWQFYLHV